MKSRHWMQIAAVASAIGLTGGAVANDMNRTQATSDTSAATAYGGDRDRSMNSEMAPPANDNAVTSDQTANPAADLNTNADVNGGAGLNARSAGNPSGTASSPSTSDVSGNASTLNDNSTSDVNGQVTQGSTQGSTMTSPKPNTSTDANAPSGSAGSGSNATSIGGQDRLGNTNSENFNTWMSDYASQHNGRISRDEFLAQMGDRWDQLDAQHNGLTPYEVQEIFVFTPPESAAPPRTGSDAQAGDMGPGNARGK